MLDQIIEEEPNIYSSLDNGEELKEGREDEFTEDELSP